MNGFALYKGIKNDLIGLVVGFALLLVLLSIPKKVDAGPCYVAPCYTAPYVEPVVAVQAVAVPVFIPIATYSVSYQPLVVQQQFVQPQYAQPQQGFQQVQPQYAPATPTPPVGTFQPQTQPQVPSTPPNAVQGQPGVQASPRANVDYAIVFQNKCAKCHEKEISKGNIAFMDGGKVMPIDSLLALRIAGAVYTKRMPPAGNDPCNDEEYGAIMTWLDSAAKASVVQAK